MIAVSILALLAATPVDTGVDLHAHVSMEDAAKPIFHGRSGTGRLADSPSVFLDNQLEANTLKAANVRLLVGAVWPPIRMRPGRSDTAEALNQLEKLESFPRRSTGFAIAKSAADARRILNGGLIAVVPAVEGGEGIHSVEDVDRYFAAGMRVLTLVHFVDNELGTAAPDQLTGAIGFKQGAQPEKGLTPLGREVVKRLVTLGVVIDLAHSSDATANEVLAIAEAAGVPVINSHTGSRELTPTARNAPDALLQWIVKDGGVVGVTSFSRMVKGVSPDWKGAKPGTCDDIVVHWQHFATVLGAEHLTFGSDFNGFVTRPERGGSCPDGLRHSGDYAVWRSALESHGIPKTALDGMGERFLQVMEKVEAGADEAARAKALRLKTDTRSVFDVPL